MLTALSRAKKLEKIRSDIQHRLNFIAFLTARDPENETKLKFMDNLMTNQEGYRIKRLTFEDLNELAENFSEK